jgi:serine phosphatase RsbU (regulator of sigma subunit)/Tfp pilus assembly protein PilF
MVTLATKKRFSSRELSEVLAWVTKVNEHTKDKKQRITGILTRGHILEYQSKNNDALLQYFEALREAEKLKDPYYISLAHKDIAEAYQIIGNKKFASKHFYFSLGALEKTDSIRQMAEVYNAIGINYKNLDKFDSALKYHEKALAIRLKLNYRKGVAYSYNNIGTVQLKQKNYKKAEEYFQKSLEIKKEEKDKKGMAGSLINLGQVSEGLNKKKEAEKFYMEGIKLATEAKAGDFLRIGVGDAARLYFQLEEYKNAALYYRMHKAISDSLKDEATGKQITELTSQYESDRKDSEIALQQEQLKLKSAQNAKQKMFTIASGIALLMALIAIVVVYRSYRQNKRNAVILKAKNYLIEEKNKEITDSINYAKLIQQSLLASKEMLDKNLDSYFIIYKPKDIVSGDFYWASETPKGFLVACVDCTGHGVPGAFMSLIGKENLDKAISKTINPGEILMELNKNVKRSLNQGETDAGSKDGMDAAILRIEKDKNGNADIAYAGANRPLYILKHNSEQVEEIKPTKTAIGGFTMNDQSFEEHRIKVSKGDTVFITTDGYADQFGSASNKKLTTKRFKELLVSVKAKAAEEQKKTLDDFFFSWKGNHEQLDDLLVIGINI